MFTNAKSIVIQVGVDRDRAVRGGVVFETVVLTEETVGKRHSVVLDLEREEAQVLVSWNGGLGEGSIALSFETGRLLPSTGRR